MSIKYWAWFCTAVLAMALCASVEAISSAVNISTRLAVQTGNNVGIAGFIIVGNGQKKVCIRALGPTMSSVQGVLADPKLDVYDKTGTLIASNDNWRTSQQDEIIAAGFAPNNDSESALIITLDPGPYTAIVRGTNNTTGVALIEVYDLDGANQSVRLGNISTRGNILTGDSVMIGGFIVSGDIPKRMIVRVRGASLTFNGVQIPGVIQDPGLLLFDGTGTQIAVNDNWRGAQEQEINATGFAPTDNREPAIVATLAPGNYTAIVWGSHNATGIGLIEAFDLDQPPQADGSTLFLADLRPQGSATTQGYGSATLRLSADGSSAIFSFQYSNLTGPITGMHIHGPADPGTSGGILFDVDAATPQPDGTYIWVITPVGGTSITDIIDAINSGRVYFNVHTAAYPSGEITGWFHLARGGQIAPTPTPAPPPPAGTPTPQDAGRFLSQATFGATDALITQVQQQGFDAFLNQQFTTPMSSHLAFVDNSGVEELSIEQTMDAWWTYAIAAPDQLRQRVAFALSEILVVSTEGNGTDDPIAMSTYMDVLVRDAFGNFRQLLEDVTLNPAMGNYLDMLGNDKSDPDAGTHPNENYAREIMQLFSIGLYRLNLDGTLSLDGEGFPVPTYSQSAVTGLAAVFTGWNFKGITNFYDPQENYRVPMVNYPSFHEPGPKSILSSVQILGGQTPQQELKIALDTIFNHPNVGPFFCRQLIQRLVTSNPSPGYVYRVASVFNNNGQGVRGDMRAVIRAILMDYDARGLAKTDPGAGHQKEPVIRLTNLMRAFHATSSDGTFSIWIPDEFGQEPLHSPTVFNFFLPDYQAPGAVALAGLRSPELQITTETTVAAVANRLLDAMWDSTYPLDYSQEMALANNPTALVDRLNYLLMAGRMSSDLRTLLINTVSQIPSYDPEERVFTAIYLVINGPDCALDN
jgi:uncharacterized protein (DUF1800 family)